MSFLLKKGSKRVYIKNNNSRKWSDPGNFSKSRFVIFRCQKYVKKGTKK